MIGHEVHATAGSCTRIRLFLYLPTAAYYSYQDLGMAKVLGEKAVRMARTLTIVSKLHVRLVVLVDRCKIELLDL